MSLSPKEGFPLLKQKIREQVEKSLLIRKEFKDWSIQDIQDFQSDLEATCKSSVSEKWFYLHFKKENDKLPRVDVLNLLANYCGYKNWEVFLFENDLPSPIKKSKKNTPLLLAIGIFILVLTILFNYDFKKKKVIIIFKDAYTQRVLKANELKLQGSLENSNWQDSGLGRSIANNKMDSLIISGPYYKETRMLMESSNDTLIVKLLPDDYALMLNYFSRADVNNIEKRERQLDQAIHEEARIFQVYEEFEGLELLNKTEFIERLILPVNFLRNLEILDIQYKDEQIYRLRFRQNHPRK